MSGSFEKSVKGGTKIKASRRPFTARESISLISWKQLAPPKAKYVEHILVATHAGDAGVAEIFRALQNRLRDSTWTIVFKALIIVHLMIREGEPNVTLKYLADSPSKLAISNFSDVQIQGTNIRHYYNYILARAKAYRDTRIDWVREGGGRLKRQSVNKGLLRETESVQNQISNLLRCDILSTEAENEITICAFRLLTMDLLVLYGVMNEGTINVLEHYFEMSKFDAERALTIYKTFTKQTNSVVEFLSTARHFENATRLEIPKLKHAPTSLTASLEEYLNDPDFETNRRQYLAQQDGRKGRKKSAIDAAADPGFKSQPVNKGSTNTGFESRPTLASAPASEPAKAAPRSPAPDLIDFFDSIEQNQTTMATQPQQQTSQYQATPVFPQQQQQVPQQTGFPPQQSQQIFGQQQAQPTGFGLQQAQPTGFAPVQGFNTQNGQQAQPQPQNNGAAGGSNPFGQPQIQQQPVQSSFTGVGFGGYSQQPQQQQQDVFGMPQNNGLPFSPQQQQQQQQQPLNTGQQAFAPNQQATNTGGQDSNPFRKSMFPQATGASMPQFQSNTPPASTPLSPQSTNPFARNMTGQPTNSPFTSPPPQQPQGTPFTSPPPPIPQSQPFQQLTPQRTGTNPFARQTPQATSFQNQAAAPLVASPTGSTNPFRQSMFHNQQTGQSWQQGQGTMGGLEQMDTVPIFPRPGQPQQQQPQPNFFS